VVTLLAHGCPVQAIVAAFGFDERTVADWWAVSFRLPCLTSKLLDSYEVLFVVNDNTHSNVSS
jgi:hypothetical protein